MKTLLLAAALLAAAPTVAQEAPEKAVPVCIRAEIVPGLEAFAKAGGSALKVGEAASLTLPSAPDQTFTPPLNRPAQPGSFGGSFPITITKAGTYRIALSAGAWIDVIGDGKRLESTAHTHGPACSGIAKIVDFTLKPGTYVVQLSAAKSPSLKVLVAKK